MVAASDPQEPLPTAEWQFNEYSYGLAHPHAVVSVEREAGTDTFTYDENGNMTARVEAGITWTQTFNAENRLASVSDGTDTWTFVYDGDRNRIKQVNPDGKITLFLGGGIYTVEDATGIPEISKYYGIGGQRVAVQNTSGLSYLLTDHLGSVIAVTDGSGQLLSQQRYLPFGGERLMPDIAQTDFGYTGQRGLEATGLIDYNARFYLPSLGRFASADTVIPDPADPQNFNRYVYVQNNPILLIDSDGHDACVPPGPCAPFPADNVLTVDDGTGPVVIRTYEITITNPSVSAEEAFDYFANNLQEFMPPDTVFSPNYGNNRVLDAGDHIGVKQYAGPLQIANTGVYVANSTSTSTTLVTQNGSGSQNTHPEAGAINFNFSQSGNSLTLTISSEARASSSFNYLGYVAQGKKVQTNIWNNVLDHAADVFSTPTSRRSIKTNTFSSYFGNPMYSTAYRRNYLQGLDVAPKKDPVPGH